ncbi:MAG: hypothetical protein GXY92_07120 [Syntrophomonadaceae bacterium]|nr:hypothetical protein [Syntrophomonadaceae bacterium]
MKDKWLEKLSHSLVEYDSGVDMIAHGTFKGKEYRVQKFFKGYRASDVHKMLEEMKRMLWSVIEQDYSTIQVPFQDVIEALKEIEKHGGVDVRYDKLAAYYGDGEKAQTMYKHLVNMGFLRKSSDVGDLIISASLTPEARALLEGIEE